MAGGFRLSSNALQVWEGGFLRLGIQRKTVLSEMSIPSFRSSPCTRGAPHKMSDFAISRIGSRISRSFAGRPGQFLRDTPGPVGGKAFSVPA